MENLPNEILVLIFDRVDIGCLAGSAGNTNSYLSNLFRCGPCNLNDQKCIHLHWSEIEGVQKIRLVCKHWNNLILKNYSSFVYM